jgi:hypothetical protein
MTTTHPNIRQAIAFEVAKNDLTNTRIVTVNLEEPLAENEVLLKVDKFALTANNISYGVAGDALGYWRFFPTSNETEQKQWGRLPVMGFADVVSSNCESIEVGERVWGFMPMASHVKILAGRLSKTGFSDVSPYREGLAPLYSAFERVNTNPFYQAKNEDYDILLRGLFTTSWLVDDFMFDNNYFNAKQYLITSASSKTSIALAFAIQQRGERPAIGITSKANKDFVESLGCYQQVVSYDEISSLDASVASILVDMAGGKTTLSAIHHHFLQQLCYSCRIGATQHNDIDINDTLRFDNLPGAKPEFFFAPTQLKKRMVDWGAAETMTQMSRSLLSYIEFCRSIISIAHTTNVNQVESVYQQVLAGKADASVGQVISL